jgi:hypothetical protein
MKYYIMFLLLLSGCASTPLEQKRESVLNCVKDLIANGAGTADSFEICRQVYEMKKLKE